MIDWAIVWSILVALGIVAVARFIGVLIKVTIKTLLEKIPEIK